MLELYTNTTAKDVLRSAYQRGQLVEASQGLYWVVIEVFGELGCGEFFSIGSSAAWILLMERRTTCAGI